MSSHVRNDGVVVTHTDQPDPVVIQLAYPDLSQFLALGNSRKLIVSRTVPDSDNLARLARAFAQAVGLELDRYNRPGMRRNIPEEWPEPIKAALAMGQGALAPAASFESFIRPDADCTLDDELEFNPDLGLCHVVIPGLCSIRSLDDLSRFIEDQQR